MKFVIAHAVLSATINTLYALHCVARYPRRSHGWFFAVEMENATYDLMLQLEQIIRDIRERRMTT